MMISVEHICHSIRHSIGLDAVLDVTEELALATDSASRC